MLTVAFKNILKNKFSVKSLLKWVLIAFVVGAFAGSASAVFLLLLEWAKETRDSHNWLLFFLPVGGVLVAACYKFWGGNVVKGNNLLIEEVQKPSKVISFLMAPLVLLGTIITHVCGGSAGREGTAVQMGAAIADQLNFIKNFSNESRKILIMCGMAAGFASLFGTPLAGTLFAMEIIILGKVRYEGLLPILLSALVANYVCDLWPIEHAIYEIKKVPDFNLLNFCWVLLASIGFGLVAMFFSKGLFWLSNYFKKVIRHDFQRAFIGGVIVSFLIYIFGFQYAGLGLETIADSFKVTQGVEVFALKIGLTLLTLSAGFKGGEVTPLFFIGASFGSSLSLLLPFDVDLLAGIGLVAVFAGATNSPIACSIMGMELFGFDAAIFIVLACFGSYYFSGHTGIYSSQIIGRPKYFFLPSLKGKRLRDLMK